MFVIGLCLIPYCNYECDFTATIVCIVIALIFGVFWYSSFVDWVIKTEQFKMVDATIHNKLIKIEEMRKTYYNPPQNTSVNIDMVNKDLASNINNEIKDLEKFVNTYNNDLAKWRGKYRFRFWNTCWIKPPMAEPINLNDYLN